MIRNINIPNLIKRVFLLLAGVQILLGLIWMAGNMDAVWRELLQISLAGGAVYYFLRYAAGNLSEQISNKVMVILTAYIVSFPVVLQCHMETLPYSPASALLLIVLTDCIRILKKEEGAAKTSCFARISIGWFLIGALDLCYGVIVGIVVLVVFFICGRRKVLKWLPLLLTVVCIIAGLGSVQFWKLSRDKEERIQNSVSSVMLSRFAWPYFMRNSYFWEPEVRGLFDDNELTQISMYPEKVLYEFGPKLEAKVGKERAREIYRQMAWDSFRIGKKDALKAIGRDVIANAGGPFAVQYQLSGRGVSYTSLHYSNLQEEMPKLTKYYVRYAFYSYDFMVLVTLIMYLKSRFGKRRPVLSVASRGSQKTVCSAGKVMICAVLGMMIFWYTMIGNGMQDYLKVIPVSVFWCMLPVWGYGCLQKAADKKKNEKGKEEDL